MKEWWHRRSGKHKARMIEASTALSAAYNLRDNGDPLGGFDALQRATNALARCGCPEWLWPADVAERIPVSAWVWQ